MIRRTIWRRYFERVETEDIDDRGMIILPTNVIDDNDTDDSNDDNLDRNISTNLDTNDTVSIPLATAVDEEEDDDTTTTTTTSENEDNENDNEFSSLTLRELEARRDEALRRSGACSMLGSYILMILWLQVFTTNNIGLLLLAILATFWFQIYIGTAQERFATLNQVLLARNNDDTDTTDATTITPRPATSSGVGEVVKQKWDTFLFNSRASLVKKENFGIHNKNQKNHNNNSLYTIDDNDHDHDTYDVDDNDDNIVNELVEEDEEEELEKGPLECSICLGEYEKGDKLVSLNPCRHVFHEACIAAWTNQNTRCPLCNIDLVHDLLPV